MPKKTEIDHYTDKEALDFHIKGKSGKIEIGSSKPLTTKRDLSLAYSPGVAAPVKEIAKNPDLAYDYTSKGNLVAVISNGTAILGLGNLGSIKTRQELGITIQHAGHPPRGGGGSLTRIPLGQDFRNIVS